LRGLAERGSGDYFFIQSPENIPLYVSTAIKGLTRLIGTSGTFTLTGEHGAIPTIYGAEGESLVYHFGDIVANDQINIVAAIEVDDTPKINGTRSCSIATWEISYKTNSTQSEQKTFRGQIIMDFTTDLSEIEEQDEEVTLAVKIKEFGSREREGKILYEEGKLAEVITHRKSYIIELKEFESKDPSGRITRLIQSANKQLLNLEKELEEKKKLSTLTPTQLEFYRRFGKFPTRKGPIIQKTNKTHFDSADFTLQKTDPNSTTGNSSLVPISPSTMLPAARVPLDNNPLMARVYTNPATAGNNNTRSSLVSKYFHSAEYLCMKDRTFSWMNAHVLQN